MLSEGVYINYASHSDDKTGKRTQTKFISLVYGAWLFAMNWAKNKIAKPTLSRFFPIDYKEAVDEPAATTFSAHFHPTTLDWTKDVQRLVREHHLVHMVVFFINYLCSCGDLPGDITADVAELLTNKVR